MCCHTSQHKTSQCFVNAYRDSGAHKQGEDEGDNVVLGGPDVHVYCIQDSEERQAPSNAINDHFLAAVEELVDDGTQEQEVDEGPETGVVSNGGRTDHRSDAHHMKKAHGAGVIYVSFPE